ncbi:MULTISPECIES: DNA replication initiation control protein YabA [Aerococcus]|uniref:DNA replication initiation control protein YabA n=1 Tax=Aerococcus sanguinicola TaxID=119206 RepID=A0A5N1GJQ3_9LACT|nr:MULTISPECIES: DNA replication initiation control protein YabA [Aerococcus]KAA9300614.1 DNA replication initiation control protein YabA [Aerococcus sanguinicola]MDK6369583.1 DNA replication initiation control protein YabA [Aerococcus sp. UMB9870]MDK6680088.1 DNA replication initiation control protein YabA [Aerococcus sp. UMB8608]MDK6686249.1 DNA replication initiation control protein YabA [Aerococcus sp. UMB8623]MDK6940168.1 DNA replication initiation control protein YabA [Aerococcus sp. UMB
MDNREMVEEFEGMKGQLTTLLENLDRLEERWSEAVMQNHDLQMENQYLRERLQELTAPGQAGQGEEAGHSPEDVSGLSPALKNLMNIYEDGYHICNISYGQRRANDEQCMFCLDILYSDR